MKEKYLKIVVVWFVLFVSQIGKEHVGLKAVTEILQDIQYKVSSYLKENKNTGYESDLMILSGDSQSSCYSHGCGL